MNLIEDKYKTVSEFFVVKKGRIKLVTVKMKQPLWWRLRWWIVFVLFVGITIYKIWIGDFEF